MVNSYTFLYIYIEFIYYNGYTYQFRIRVYIIYAGIKLIILQKIYVVGCIQLSNTRGESELLWPEIIGPENKRTGPQLFVSSLGRIVFGTSPGSIMLKI